MRVILDNETCSIEAQNLGEALAAASHLAEDQGRLVVEVLVDGNPLTDAQLREDSVLEDSVSEIQLKTTTAAQLLFETFSDASEAILDTQKVQQSAAELIQSSQSEQGMRALGVALASWGEIHEAMVKGLLLAGEDPETMTIGDSSFMDASKALQKQLSELRTAIEAQDASAMCDCLLYEFPPVCESWANMLRLLAERYDSSGNDHSEGGS